MRLLIIILFSLVICLPSFAQDTSNIEKKELDISAQCNVYIYNLSINKKDVPGGAGIEPVIVPIGEGIKYITFENTSGMVTCSNWNDSAKKHGADGGGPWGTAVLASKGMSGISHGKKNLFLVGVFTSRYLAPEMTPETVDYTDNENINNWGPQLWQVFMIGDGKTDKGITQNILVPSEADQLLIGFADALRGDASNYDDNEGNIHTTIVLHKNPLHKN